MPTTNKLMPDAELCPGRTMEQHMADTKNWKETSRSMRRGIKRSQRKVLKSLYGALTPSQRSKFNKAEEKVGIKVYVKSLEAEG